MKHKNSAYNTNTLALAKNKESKNCNKNYNKIKNYNKKKIQQRRASLIDGARGLLIERGSEIEDSMETSKVVETGKDSPPDQITQSQ